MGHIKEAPLLYQKKNKQLRTIKLNKFPYLLVFEIIENKLISNNNYFSHNNFFVSSNINSIESIQMFETDPLSQAVNNFKESFSI